MEIIKCFDNIDAGRRFLLCKIFTKYTAFDNDLNLFTSIYNTDELVVNILDEKINNLDNQIQMIIKRYSGIDGPKLTLIEISKIIGKSSTRVYQIKDKTLRILAFALHSSANIKRINMLHESLLDATIDILPLSVRSYNALRRGGIYYVTDILKLNAYDLLHLRNFGIKSLHELINVIKPLEYNEWVKKINNEISDAVKIKDTTAIYSKLSNHSEYDKKINRSLTKHLESLNADYDGDELIKGGLH